MLITVNLTEGTQAEITGDKVASNQAQIYVDGGDVLVSYSQPVAAVINGVFYKTTAFWSVTTNKHITTWRNLRGSSPAQGISLPVKTIPQETLYALVRTLVGEPTPKLP
jgi:hypothetical protein